MKKDSQKNHGCASTRLYNSAVKAGFVLLILLSFSTVPAAASSSYLDIGVVAQSFDSYPCYVVFTFDSFGYTNLTADYGDGTGIVDLTASSQTVSHTYTQPGVYTVTISGTSADGSIISATKEIIIRAFAKDGEITVSVDRASYYLGDSFTVFGINTYSDKVALYIQGNNFQSTLLVAQPITVSADGSWSVTLDSHGLADSRGHKQDVGTYSITAVAMDRFDSSSSSEVSSYTATVAAVFKQPYIGDMNVPDTIPRGEDITISGTATGSIDSLQYYLFGAGNMTSGFIPVSDDTTFSYQIPTDNLAFGSYYLVVQHPMYDKMFNISPVSESDGSIYIKLYHWGGSAYLFKVNDCSSSTAAQALCDALDTQNIDDMYVKSSFIVYPGDGASDVLTLEAEVMPQDDILHYSVSGFCAVTDIVSLYLQYPDGNISAVSSVSCNDIHVYSASFNSSRVQTAGQYTLFAVAGEPDAEISEILACPHTSSVYLLGLTGSPDSDVFVLEKPVTVSGSAVGTLLVQYYVFGTNFFTTGSAIVTDDTYEFSVSSENMTAGQYFLVLQHPMQDGVFNIGPKGSEIVLNPIGSYTSPDSILLFDVSSRQTANAAQALCDALDTQNIDDMYVKSSFFLVGQDFSINDIPTQIVKGDTLVISGINNANAGETLVVEMISTAFAAVPKETVGSAAFIAATTVIADDGTWEVTLDTSGLNVDEYVLSVAVNSAVMKSVRINLLDSNEPVPAPTPDNSAFIYSSKDAVVTPSGVLTVGQRVTATMNITVRGGSLGVSDKISFSTPLAGAKWSTDIYRGGVAIVNNYESSSISGFMLESDADLVLHISLSGTVYSASEGKEISVMSITGTTANGYSFFSTESQRVYGTEDFATNLASAKKAATDLKMRSVGYAGYGIDTVAVNQSIIQAEAKLSAAESAGIANLVVAYANIAAAEELFTEAERALYSVGLRAVDKNIAEIGNIISTLRDYGMISEIQYLRTNVTSLRHSYDTLVATYKSGVMPDAEELDALVYDSYGTLEKANAYLTGAGKFPTVLTLKDGWNFISVPKVLTAESAVASTFFAGVDTADNAVLFYNASAQGWNQVTASAVIKPLTGYWVYSNGTADIPLSYVTTPTVPAVKQLYSGWNAVGVSADCAVPAASFLAGTPWRVALPWNLDAGNWKNAIVNGGSSVNSAEQYLILGNGIWVYAESEGTLIGLTA